MGAPGLQKNPAERPASMREIRERCRLALKPPPPPPYILDDGSNFSLPGPARWLMSLLMKQKFLTKPIPAGFKSTKEFIPDPTSTEEGLADLRRAIARQQQEETRVPHPGFGKMTRDEWDAFNLRHAEMHMSFAVPKSNA